MSIRMTISPRNGSAITVTTSEVVPRIGENVQLMVNGANKEGIVNDVIWSFDKDGFLEAISVYLD